MDQIGMRILSSTKYYPKTIEEGTHAFFFRASIIGVLQILCTCMECFSRVHRAWIIELCIANMKRNEFLRRS